MLADTRPYQPKLLLSFGIFLVSGIAAIIMQEPVLLVIPFAWIFVPVIFQFAVTRTEQLFWLLLILLPLSTELTITPQLGLDFPDELLLMLLTGISIVKLIHQPEWFPASLSKHPLFFILVVDMGWMLITCVYATEPLLAIKYVLAKTWYIIPFVLLPQILLHSRERVGKLAICLLLPMLFVVIQSLLRHAFYGFSFKDIQQVLAPFFRNHVNYSSMLVCLLPVAWCVWTLTPAENPKRKIIGYGILIGLIGLLFAYSRGAWIALLAGIIAVWVIRKRLMGAFMMLAILGVIISTVWLVTDKNYMRFAPDHDRTVFHTNFSEHMLATVEMKDVSTAERFYRWIAGARMLADKPITGFGPNAFYPHYRSYTVNRFETWVSDNKEHSTVHNYFLLTALEQGIIGLILFCALYFGMLLHVQRLYHQFQSRFYKQVTLTVGMVLIMIGVINTMSDMIETDKIGSLFWLCLGMVVLLDSKGKEERELLA
jgi:O-antigen ligase